MSGWGNLGNAGCSVESIGLDVIQAPKPELRYDKLAAKYLASINLASIRIWLRG